MRPLYRLLPAAALAALFALNAGPALAEKEGAAGVEVGKPAPPIDLPAANIGKALPGHKGNTLRLDDLKGKNVVLFFFPKAMTPGCTAQSCGFRDLQKEFANLDTVVIGI